MIIELDLVAIDFVLVLALERENKAGYEHALKLYKIVDY